MRYSQRGIHIVLPSKQAVLYTGNTESHNKMVKNNDVRKKQKNYSSDKIVFEIKISGELMIDELFHNQFRH